VKTQLLIAAAGAGERLGCAGPKALAGLGGVPMVVRTLQRIEALGLAEDSIVLAPLPCMDEFAAALAIAFPDVRIRCIAGGDHRQESVSNGLDALDGETDIVVIHDAARPFVTPESVRASIEAARDCGAATVAIPAIDTILEGTEDGYLAATPDRSRMWACQTPQTFRVEIIRQAHHAAAQEGYFGTDDASLVQRQGGKVKLVMGSALNMKITTPSDLSLARLLFERGMTACV
jgi:2-C-methyl-D-erythritol 4-phosphate cytidylyltransferase